MRFFSIMARRVFYALALLLAVIIFNFILLSMVPGDIAETIAGESGGASAEVMAEIRASYGLDQPFHVQLFTYVSKVLQGDGQVLLLNIPVNDLILERVARLFWS